ncbi:MAG: hypothetical protein ABIS86_16640 [Streptosporangiaceae bacterium]
MPSRAPGPITADCFPVPTLLLRTNHPGNQRTIRAFAHQQAMQASSLLKTLAEALPSTEDLAARSAVFTAVFEATEDWRYRIAAASPEPTGRYGRSSAERFRQPVTDDNPNLFRIGEHERLREGARWNSATRTYLGGTETPASRTMKQTGVLAAARFPTSSGAEVIQNQVNLDSGHRVPGMRLLRGAAARSAAVEMVARIRTRGRDTSHIITDGDLIYCASAKEADRTAIFRQAMDLLAHDHATEAAALTAWLQATYMIYQAPRRKRGSDAATRTFLMAAGTYLLHRPPTLLDDIDMRAIVLPQESFVAELRTVQRGRSEM